MRLSIELQTGKAGEHFVCCDLIKQGFNAFLADQGLPYDVVVDTGSKLLRVQVKTTGKIVTYGKSPKVYRFHPRRGKGSSAVKIGETDFFAFVALDIYSVAYVSEAQMIARTGGIKQCLDFKSRLITYVGRSYSNGTVRCPVWGKHLQDFSTFNP